MIDDLKRTILNRVINELFQEADKLIKEGLKLTEKNKKIVTLGFSLSVAGLVHAFFPTGAAIALDMVNIFLTGGSLAGNNIDLVKKEVDMVKKFFDHFNIEKEEIANILKTEFNSDLRIGTYFEKQYIDAMIGKGILDLKTEEIAIFSQIRFNDNQEQYLKNLISKNEKINVINFLDLTMLEASSQNNKFVNLGGKNKTLKEIVSPTKKIKLMK